MIVFSPDFIFIVFMTVNCVIRTPAFCLYVHYENMPMQYTELSSEEQPEDQWSYKRSPETRDIYQ